MAEDTSKVEAEDVEGHVLEEGYAEDNLEENRAKDEPDVEGHVFEENVVEEYVEE